MPTPVVKSPQAAAGRWQRRASSAGGEYREGIERTGKSWSANASAAKQNYITGVQEAQGRDAFSKGVQSAGDQKWRGNSVAKGPGRYSEGVNVGQGDYERGVAPFLEVASRTDLPMRGATGSESNYQRSVTMAKAFRAAKTGRK
jgi:hypothetical protein